jgi:metal-dependent amidase/aminoacylase/carboxypeptidase family protein
MQPGAVAIANEDHGAGLHHPAYDFNDSAIGAGVSYWSRLIETRLAT